MRSLREEMRDERPVAGRRNQGGDMSKTTGAFGDDPMFAPRYMNIPTFMRTPVVKDPSDVDIALIGVPYDNAVTNRPGARHGLSGLRPVHPRPVAHGRVVHGGRPAGAPDVRATAHCPKAQTRRRRWHP